MPAEAPQHLTSLPKVPSKQPVIAPPRQLLWPGVVLALVLLFNLIYSPGFFHLEMKDGRVYGTLVDVFNRGTPVILLALGMTLVIATGGIDLSVGAVMALAGSVGAVLLLKWGSAGSALAGAGLVCVFAGLWNGFLVGVFRIPPIVATLVLMVAGRGIAQLLTDGQILTFNNASYEFLGRGYLGGLPVAIPLSLITLATLYYFTRATAAGLFIEATGDNERAAQYSGINTRIVKLCVYTVASVCAGVAGLIVTTNIRAADANNTGLWMELDAILAVVIGGTPLQGGRFTLAGSFLGAILIQTVTTTIVAQNVPVEMTLVVKALVIIVVCLFHSPRFRAVFRRKAQA